MMSEKLKNRVMSWNGNELVFADDPMRGVAGIAHDQPDELGELIAQAWNTRPREAELEAKCKELENWKRHATDLLMADKFKIDQLQARVKLLERVVAAFMASGIGNSTDFYKQSAALSLANKALRGETSEEVE